MSDIKDINSKKVVVFDIDGTLTDTTHRNHILDELVSIGEKYTKEFLKENKELKGEVNELKDNVWLRFSEASVDDSPIQKTIDLLNYYKSKGFKVYAMSGRADEVRDQTEKYFKDLGIEFDLLKMRRKEQKMPSTYLKNAWLNKYIIKEGHSVECVFEDDTKVIDYLTKKGFNCRHVDDIKDSPSNSVEKKAGRKPKM